MPKCLHLNNTYNNWAVENNNIYFQISIKNPPSPPPKCVLNLPTGIMIWKNLNLYNLIVQMSQSNNLEKMFRCLHIRITLFSLIFEFFGLIKFDFSLYPLPAQLWRQSINGNHDFNKLEFIQSKYALTQVTACVAKCFWEEYF